MNQTNIYSPISKEQSIQINMELLPNIKWNDTLNKTFHVVAQILEVGNGEISIRKEMTDHTEYTTVEIHSNQVREMPNNELKLKLVWSDKENLTYVTDATNDEKEVCSLKLVETFICNDSRKMISVNEVCDGKYDCSDDQSDISDENNNFCKTEPSLTYVYAIIFYVVLGILAFNAVYWKVGRRFGTTMTITDDGLPLTQKIINACKDGTMGSPDEGTGDELKVIEVENFYPECDEVSERKFTMKILRTLWLYRPFRKTVVNIVQRVIEVEAARHANNPMEYIQCLRICKGEESYTSTFVKDMMEYHDCFSKVARKLFGLFTFRSDAINLLVKATFHIVTSMLKITLFYYDLVKDMVILESLFFIDKKILLDDDSENKYESVGGLDFTLLAYYLVSIFVVSELAIYFLMYLRRGLYFSCFKIKEDMHFLKLIVTFFPLHFTILETCSINVRMAWMEYKITRVLKDLYSMDECNDMIAKQIVEIAYQLDELEKQAHVLNNLECEIQILETCLEREPQLIVQISLFILMNQFSRIKLLFEDSFYGIPLDFIMITTICLTIFSMVMSIKRYRDRKRFPNTSGIKGTIIQFVAIAALLVPKLLVISLALLNMVYLHPILYFLNTLIVILVNRQMFGDNISYIDAMATALTPAFYKAPAREEIGRDETEGENIMSRLWRKAKRLRSFLVTSIHHCVTFLIYFVIGYILRRVSFPTSIVLSEENSGGIFGEYLLNEQTLVKEFFSQYWLIVFSIFAAGYILHLIFTQLYYLIGHPWSIGREPIF